MRGEPEGGHHPLLSSQQAGLVSLVGRRSLSLILFFPSSILILFVFSPNSSDSENRLSQLTAGFVFVCSFREWAFIFIFRCVFLGTSVACWRSCTRAAEVLSGWTQTLSYPECTLFLIQSGDSIFSRTHVKQRKQLTIPCLLLSQIWSHSESMYMP